jgi:hypothetical protein
MPTIYNPPQNMRAIVMHHVVGATDDDLQKMRPTQVYLDNIDALIGQSVIETAAGIPFYYAARLTQTGENGPVATELFNSIDATLAWTRSGEGVYVLAPLSGTPFPEIRTLILVTPSGAFDLNAVAYAAVDVGGGSITLTTTIAAIPVDDAIVNGLFFFVMVFHEVA